MFKKNSLKIQNQNLNFQFLTSQDYLIEDIIWQESAEVKTFY